MFGDAPLKEMVGSSSQGDFSCDIVSAAHSITGPATRARTFVLPLVWNDDDVMYELMQPIKRPKHVDPDTYSRKVDFWGNVILRYAKDQRVLVVSVRALQSLFVRYFPEEDVYLSPSCLHEVLQSLRQSDEVELIEHQSNFVLSTVMAGFHYFVKTPLSALYKLAFNDTPNSVVSTPTKNDDELYVFSKLSESLIEEFIKSFNEAKSLCRLTMRLMAYENNDFEHHLREFFPHEATRNFVRNLCSSKYQCIKLERMCNTSADVPSIIWVSESVHDGLPPITSSESQVVAGLARLGVTIKHLEADMTALAEQIDSRRTEIKSLLGQKKMTEAKNLLKRTKLIEQTLERKQLQLQNLESTRLQLDGAADSQNIVRVLADSGRALKATTGGEAGLREVEETMNELSEGARETSEVSELIASFGRNTLSTDDDDLEAELHDLIGPSPAASTDATHDARDIELERELAKLSFADFDLPNPPKTTSTRALLSD